jgi:hypothetical protein
VAESASIAIPTSKSMKFCGWPLNSPPARKVLMIPTASSCPAEVGRITAHMGRLELIKSHGTGKIRFVWSRGFTVMSKFGNAGSPFAAANGAFGGCTAFSEKSTHSRKWHSSSPPILSVIFKASALETFWLRVAYRLEPPCSINPK